MKSDVETYSCMYIIVEYGIGKKIEKTIRSKEILYFYETFGFSCVNNDFFDLIGLSDEKKEVLFFILKNDMVDEIFEILKNQYNFEKNKSFAFTIFTNLNNNLKSMEDSMKSLITVIVDRGKAEDVVKAAHKGGSKGATIINGRGSTNSLNCQKLFAMEIEPEKEMVMIISDKSNVDNIINSIKSEINLEKENSGILFTQDIDKSIGILK